ncbi:MAG: iron-containing redox enzyme family protein [Bdellovibrionota bacterium]
MTEKDVKAVFDKIHTKMYGEAERFPWSNKEAYVSWLAQTLEYVSYGTRVLALTAGHFPLDKTALAARFIQHAGEEKGHDKLLYNDAKALGVALSEVPVLAEAEAFHKSVYFWIYHARPAVIMGWILFLEGFAIKSGPMIHERALKSHGPKPTTFLKVHTQEDPDHVDKALEVLKVFSEAELQDVAHGLELYSELYINILNSIKAKQGTLLKRAA